MPEIIRHLHTHALFVLWNYDSFGEYWFGGWWRTVRDKPLRAACFAIRAISEAMVSFRKLQPDGTSVTPKLNESKQP
jgi:hypothetical protein